MVAAADPNYEISVENSIETPEQTITLADQQFTINSIASYDQGENINVRVSVPEDSDVSVDLYDSEQRLVNQNVSEQGENVKFETTSMDHGTYLLALSDGQEYVDIVFVVINGYNIETQYDESTERGLPIEYSVTASPTLAETKPNEVRIVAWNDDNIINKTIGRNNGSYKSNIIIDQKGDYHIYILIEGEKTYENKPIWLAVEEGDMITIEDDSDAGEEDDSDAGEEDDSDAGEEDDSDAGEDSIGQMNESDSVSGDTDIIEPNTTTNQEPLESGNSVSEDNESMEIDDDMPHTIGISILSLLIAALGIARINKTIG